MFLESSYAPLRHFVLCVASSFFGPICSICFSIYLLLVTLGCPRFLLPTPLKFYALLNTSPLSILKTFPYRRAPFALAILSKVSSRTEQIHKFLTTPFFNLFDSTRCFYHSFCSSFKNCSIISPLTPCLAPV